MRVYVRKIKVASFSVQNMISSVHKPRLQIARLSSSSLCLAVPDSLITLFTYYTIRQKGIMLYVRIRVFRVRECNDAISHKRNKRRRQDEKRRRAEILKFIVPRIHCSGNLPSFIVSTWVCCHLYFFLIRLLHLNLLHDTLSKGIMNSLVLYCQ